jgi:hypothetical protein
MTYRWLLLAMPLALSVDAEGVRPTPNYTNEDLERVHPYREETGVASLPASRAQAEASPSPTARSKGRRVAAPEAREEAYWRREAQRHRQALAKLERRAAALREKIEQGGKSRGQTSKRRAVPSSDSARRQLAEVTAQIEQIDSEFEERSRRAGALPGWLR